jgi:hypothetical protein
MSHRTGRLVFALSVGLLVAVLSYRWITDPAPRAERALEESIIGSARTILAATLAIGELEVVDALAPNRKAGKTYIYRAGDGWEVSGYYRRSEDDRWHAYLLSLDSSIELRHLKIQDSDQELLNRFEGNSRLEAVP